MVTSLADQFLLHYSEEEEWHQPRIEIARKNNETKRVNTNNSSYSFWTNIEDFQRYGPGIFLFFKFMKVFMWGILIIGFLSLPTIINNYTGGGLNSFRGGWNKFLVTTTVANQHFNKDLTQSHEVKLLQKLDWNKSLVIWNDVICSISFLILLFYWKVSAAKLSRTSILHQVLPSSFTIIVSDLPLVYKQETLRYHFQKFGQVVEISPVKNISDLKHQADRIDVIVSKILTQMKNNNTKNEKQQRKELEMYLNMLLSYRESYKASKVQAVIVSFNSMKTREYVSDIYKYKIGSEEMMNYECSPLKVSKLKIQPVNIIWQNFHFNKDHQLKKSLVLGVIIFFITFGGLILLFLIRVSSFVQLPVNTNQQYTKEQVLMTKDPIVINTFCYNLNYQGLKEYFQLCKHFLTNYTIKLLKSVEYSFVIIILNLILNQAINLLVKFRKYPTVSEKNRFSILCMFVFMFFTNCILTLIVQGEVGSLSIRSLLENIFMTRNIKQIPVYKQFSRAWFIDIGSQIIINCIVSLIICPPLSIITQKALKIIRQIRASRSIFQWQMNQTLLDPVLDINFYYSQLLTTLFFCLMYSSAMPILYFLSAASFLVIYCSSKLMFVKYTRQPDLLDHSLDILISRLIPLGIFLHQIMSLVFFSVQQFFPNRIIIFNMADRMIVFLRQGFPFVMLLIVIGIYIVYQKEIDKFLIRHLTDNKSPIEKPLKEILKLQSKYIYSYRIEDNPQYTNLLKILKILQEVERYETRVERSCMKDELGLQNIKLTEYSNSERTLI